MQLFVVYFAILYLFLHFCSIILQMLKQERQHIILNKLKIQRNILSVDLSKELSVSEDTIRRDLNELANKRLLQKVHGGALSLENRLVTYNERSHINLDKKVIIANKAVNLIKSGQVIIMSGSTTNLELAKIIPPEINATIFTYSLPIASQLSQHPFLEVIFMGGKINKSAQITCGINVVDCIATIRADVCFMGIGGISIKEGMTEPDWEVSQVKKAMITASNNVVAMCISSKINLIESYLVTRVDKINTIVSDIEPDDAVFDDFKEKGIVVI